MHPQAEQESHFRRFLLGVGDIWRIAMVNFAAVACVLRATNKKVVNFLKEKSAPRLRLLWSRQWESNSAEHYVTS